MKVYYANVLELSAQMHIGLGQYTEASQELDKATRESLVNALDKYDGTIICATHDKDILDTIATHVYEMRDGACVNTRIIEAPAPIKDQPKQRKGKNKK